MRLKELHLGRYYWIRIGNVAVQVIQFHLDDSEFKKKLVYNYMVILMKSIKQHSIQRCIIKDQNGALTTINCRLNSAVSTLFKD
jgi:hypothetical protein